MGFSSPAAQRKLSVWEEVQAKYKMAGAAIAAEERRGKSGGAKASLLSSKSFKSIGGATDSFSVPEKFRSLDSVKGLPRSRSTPRSRKQSSRHPSGARSVNESSRGRSKSPDGSLSGASTSLTARSAFQVQVDRAFKEGFLNAELFPTSEVVKRLDIKPLDVEGGKRGIGKDPGRVWKSKLRETQPNSSKGDPVANNALSKSGIQAPAPPGFFAQVPERLGQWRDDIGSLEAQGFDNNGPTKGQWVPESVMRRKEREQASKDAKARRDALDKARWKIEEEERLVRERAAAEAAAIEAAERDAKMRAKRDEEDKAAAERRRKKAEEARKAQEERMARLMKKGS